MLQLSPVLTFHFELLRVLGGARKFGSDVGEVLTVAENIIPGDFESWYKEFSALATHIDKGVTNFNHPVSARNALFRAANYYRSSDFFLHGNPNDPRINETWENQRRCFDKAISLMDIPGERFEIETPEFNIPAILYCASKDNTPRQTILMCTGYDGSQEELFHTYGFDALDRGYNVITFEGPGQPTVVRAQRKGFITEWEKAVTPIVDYCHTLTFVDPQKIILLGNSFGAFLVARAAAFEHRLAAVICVDGLYDIFKAFSVGFDNSPELQTLFNNGQKEKLDSIVRAVMLEKDNLQMRWGIEQGCWAFCTDSIFEFLTRTKSMTMENIVDDIQCPVLVCGAEEEHFFAGQPELLVEALGNKATFFELTRADSAQYHCHVGAADFTTSKIMDWVEEIVLK